MLRQVRCREEGHLLCTNLSDRDPAALWALYMQLVQIEAHIFVAFLAYALHATLPRRLKDLAPGPTSCAVFEKLQAIRSGPDRDISNG
ncbi:MAG: hypothetical protein EHM71_02660 [Zetaproteobacteria bacterium]|nr:MAG: hypothetical protein EHM71_02660 [Zetaproteobacteria bacterium]